MSKNTALGDKESNKYVPDPEKVREIEERIVNIRLGLIFSMPFWAMMCTRLTLQDASGWCKTAATDGRCLYYNVDFFSSMTDDEIMFVMAHEILHCVYDHFMRLDGRDRHIFNCAADFAINFDLKESNVGKMPEIGLYDPKYGNKIAEEIYDELAKNAKQCESMSTLDEHLDVYSDDDNGGSSEGDDGDGEYRQGDENNRPKVSPSEMEKISEEVRNAVITAEEQGGSGASSGHIPSSVRNLIKRWKRSQVDWRNYITTRYKSDIKHDSTYMRPSRRGELDGGILLPGMNVLDQVKAHVSIDTSGSMTDEMLTDLLSEVRGLMEQFVDFELHVWCFDTTVHPESYKVFNAYNLEEIADYKMYGGGGTLFMSNWEFMKEQDIQPDTLLLFTDGFPCDSWGDPNYCDTVFLVHGSKDIVADFGTTLYYDSKRN